MREHYLIVEDKMVKAVTTAKRWWYGPAPEKCYICSQPISSVFIDGRIRFMQSWSIMCPTCFDSYGSGLGLGNGQMYNKQDNGHFLKVGE